MGKLSAEVLTVRLSRTLAHDAFVQVSAPLLRGDIFSIRTDHHPMLAIDLVHLTHDLHRGRSDHIRRGKKRPQRCPAVRAGEDDLNGLSAVKNHSGHALETESDATIVWTDERELHRDHLHPVVFMILPATR